MDNPYLLALASEHDSLSRQSIDFKFHFVNVRNSISGIESEYDWNTLTRFDYLSMEIVLEMRCTVVQAMNSGSKSQHLYCITFITDAHGLAVRLLFFFGNRCGSVDNTLHSCTPRPICVMPRLPVEKKDGTRWFPCKNP